MSIKARSGWHHVKVGRWKLGWKFGRFRLGLHRMYGGVWSGSFGFMVWNAVHCDA